MSPKKIKLTAGVAIAAIALCAGVWHLSPYITLLKMKRAIERADAAAFNSTVDYPRLRVSLKAEVTKKLQLDTPSDSTSQAMNGNGAAFTLMLASTLVDRFVQPEVLGQAVKNGKVKDMLGKLEQVAGTDPNQAPQQWDVQRQSASQFVLWNAPKRNATIGLVFQRNPWGIDWKLAAIVSTPKANPKTNTPNPQ